MAERANQAISYDDANTPKGKPVEETKLLDTTAREPQCTVSIPSPLKRDVGKHKPFGKLGVKGFP